MAEDSNSRTRCKEEQWPHLEERRNVLPIELDHLEVCEAVDTTHVESHDGQYDTQGYQHLAEWNYEHRHGNQDRCY